MKTAANFSRQTIVEAITLLEEWEHSKIERFILKFELENKISYKEMNRPQIANMVIHKLIEERNLPEPGDISNLYDVVEHIAGELKEPKSDIPAFMGNQLFSDPAEKFKNSLFRDGYKIKDGKLISVVPHITDPSSREDEFRKLAEEKGPEEILTFIDHAISAHTAGNWETVNQYVMKMSEKLSQIVPGPMDPLFEAFLKDLKIARVNISEEESTFQYHLAILLGIRMLSA